MQQICCHLCRITDSKISTYESIQAHIYNSLQRYRKIKTPVGNIFHVTCHAGQPKPNLVAKFEKELSSFIHFQ